MAGANSGPPKWQQYSPAGSGWLLSHARWLPNPEPGGNKPSRKAEGHWRTPDYSYKCQIRISKNPEVRVQMIFAHFGPFDVWIGAYKNLPSTFSQTFVPTAIHTPKLVLNLASRS